jgi:hypothetical protein
MKHYAMKTYGGVDVEIQLFLTLALLGGEWSASCPNCFIPKERAPGTQWIVSWVCCRTSLDDVERRKIYSYQGSNSNPSAIQPVSSCYTDFARGSNEI